MTDNDALLVRCPVCQAAPGHRCYAIVLSTSTTIGLDEPHPARQQLADAS